jgi:hypothetical protein
VDARILHALTDDGAAPPTTQPRPGTGHNGGPVFGLHAAWLRFSSVIELRRLATLQVRIERKQRTMNEMISERQRIMNRCIRRMRRSEGKK